MEGASNVDAFGLPSSVAVTEQATFDHNHQATATNNAQGQMDRLEIEEELPAAMNGTMEDSQSNVVYHLNADWHSVAEDVHVTRQPNNTVNFRAGIQHSEVNRASSESGSEGEIQESGIGGGPVDDYGLPNSHERAYDDVNDEERGIFVDFDEEPDVDEDDKKIEEEEITFDFDCIKAFVYPQAGQIISQHLSTPSQQSFTSLNDLLSSHNAPGRGLYNMEKLLEHEEGRVAELEEIIKNSEAELEKVSARRDKADGLVRNAHTTFSKARGAARIHDDLWKEYEVFCESLEPKFGSRGGWSVTCFENHNGSYVKWDPDLDLFIESAEMSLGSCNFRCEATAIERKGRTEYVVEFWPLASPEPRSEIARTWRHQYPKLYRLAEQAANETSQGNTLATALLRSLPNPNLPFSGGWLFEYALEPGRAQHPTVSRRWSYRSACRIPIDGQQDEDDVTVQPESESAESQDEEMSCDDSEAAENGDVKMEDTESGSDEGQKVKMEEDDWILA